MERNSILVAILLLFRQCRNRAVRGIHCLRLQLMVMILVPITVFMILHFTIMSYTQQVPSLLSVVPRAIISPV